MYLTGDEKPVRFIPALQRISIVCLVATVSTMAEPSAIVTLSIDGECHTCQKKGDGCVDAVFTTINACFPNNVELEHYEVQAANPGSKALAKVKVSVSLMGRSITAEAENADTIIASAHAYIEALNQLHS